MIKSQKQYLAAKNKIKMLQDGLAQPLKPGVPEVLANALEGQTQELLHELEEEVAAYESLIDMRLESISIESMEDLMSAPIRYRLAKKMTLEEFSRKVDVHSRQIARYESEEYRNITTETLFKILKKLEVHLSGDLRV